MKANDGLWHNPKKKYHGKVTVFWLFLTSHLLWIMSIGTHVAGVIGASGANNAGMQGVIGDGNFCFLIARVFGETNNHPTRMSDIFQAVEWLADKGARIINMSLGSDLYSKEGEELMKRTYEEGILLVASSGNSGTTTNHFPANFNHVLSVAAVGEDLSKADFSQYNSGVDITAPGVGILSTFPPGLGEALFVSSTEMGAIGSFLLYSTKPSNVSGKLLDCPDYGMSRCPGPGSHICLIER